MLVVTVWLELCTSYGSNCHHSPPPSSLAPITSRMETFWYRLIQVVLKNGCKTSVVACLFYVCHSLAFGFALETKQVFSTQHARAQYVWLNDKCSRRSCHRVVKCWKSRWQRDHRQDSSWQRWWDNHEPCWRTSTGRSCPIPDMTARNNRPCNIYTYILI